MDWWEWIGGALSKLRRLRRGFYEISWINGIGLQGTLKKTGKKRDLGGGRLYATANFTEVSSEMKYADITEKIIGSCFKVHSFLGNGFQEVIYQRALAIELTTANLPFKREFEMGVYYHGMRIGTRRVDFLVDDKISVEMKAVTHLEHIHLAQAMNYLEAYNLEVGILVNFGPRSLEFKRLTNKKFTEKIPDP